MSMRELNKLKKMLLEANKPNREKELARALRVMVKGIDEDESTVIEGITVQEAFNILS